MSGGKDDEDIKIRSNENLGLCDVTGGLEGVCPFNWKGG